jgi:RNA polymerase sigma factor (sigma-70 family)
MKSDNQRERFERCFHEHAPAIVGYALRRTSSADDAADVLAETMLVAWRRVDDLPEEPETVLWLYGIARNVLLNMVRSQRRRTRLTEKLTGLRLPHLDESNHGDWVAVSQIQAVVSALPERDREILLLASTEGLSSQQIGDVLEMNSNTVRTVLHRVRRELSEQLNRIGHVHVEASRKPKDDKEVER